MAHLKIQPAGQVPLSNSGRKPVIKVVGGDTWRVSLNLYNPANPAEAANPDNTTVTVKLADTQFDEPIWVGEWLNGVEPDDKRKDLCYLVVPKNITQSLRRGNYMFSVRVADLLKTRIETEAEGSFLVEYKVTSDQHSIPYKDGTSGAAGGAGGGSLDYVESINGKTGKVSLSAVDIGAATSAQGAKADSAIQTVKVNGAVITPDEDKSVDVPVPVTSVNSKTGAVSLDANDVGALSHTGDQTLSNGSLTIEKDDPDGGIWLKIKRWNESGITLHFSYISFNGNTFDLPSSSGVLALLSDIAVKSVNSKTGIVQLDASDVGAVATSDVVTPDANAEPGKVADAKATGDALTYTKEWVEALTPNDRGSGKTHITFKPTGFGARSNFRLKSFTIMSSDVAARLPSQPVYAKVIDPEAPLHAKAVSHPVSVTSTNTNYTFVFDESEELIYNKQYKMIFSSGADDGSPLLIFGVRVYNATEDQDIYYADFPRMKPITGWVYSYNSLVTGVNDELDSRVPTTRTINNKELSTDISLTASDVGALPADSAAANNIEAYTSSPGVYALKITNRNNTYYLYLPVNTTGTLALLSDIYTAIQQIAPPFRRATGMVYYRNDLCTYNGVVYRCNELYSVAPNLPNPDSDTRRWTAMKVSELFMPLTGGTMEGEITFRDGNLAEDYDNLRKWSLASRIGEMRLTNTDGNTILFPVASGTLALLETIAPAFSTSATYEVNKLCVYANALYRCTTAVTTAGAWTGSTNWTAATVEDVLALLAPLTSPVFTGTPTAPDIGLDAPDGQIANKKYVNTLVDTESPLVARSFPVQQQTGWTEDEGSAANPIYFRPRFFGMKDGDLLKGIVLRTRSNNLTPFPSGVYMRIKRYSDGQTLGVSELTVWPNTATTDVVFSFPQAIALPSSGNYYALDFSTTPNGDAVNFGMRVYVTPSGTTNPDFYFIRSTIVPIATAQFYSWASDLVPSSRKINGHALTEDVALTASDIDYPVQGSTMSVQLALDDIYATIASIRYDLGTTITIDSYETDTTDHDNPITYAEVTLLNRTANVVVINVAIDELRVTLPAATNGKVRDLGLEIVVGDGTAALSAPALVISGAGTESPSMMNPDGAMPKIADGTATAPGVTLLYFSEVAEAVFLVKGEQVKEVTQ